MTDQQREAHVYLRVELRQIEADINACMAQINAYRMDALPRGIAYDGIKVQSGRATADDALARMVDKMEPYKRRLAKLCDERVDKLDEVVRLINSLPDAQERALMTDVYISNIPVEAAGKSLYVSRRKAYYIRNQALDEIYKTLHTMHS